MLQLWGALWRSENTVIGKDEHLMYYGEVPMLFTSRKDARKWIKENYGYILRNEELQREPHGWKMPVAVKVRVEMV